MIKNTRDTQIISYAPPFTIRDCIGSVLLGRKNRKFRCTFTQMLHHECMLTPFWRELQIIFTKHSCDGTPVFWLNHNFTQLCDDYAELYV